MFFQSLPFNVPGLSGRGADEAFGIVTGSCSITSTVDDLVWITLEDSVTTETSAAGRSERED